MIVILGGGVTGLTILECLLQSGEKEVRLITKDIGGQMLEENMGPRILDYSLKAERFLKNIGIYEKPVEFQVGYLHKNGRISGGCSQLERLEYFKKTRGKQNNWQDSCLSGGRNKILGWDWNGINLVQKLYELNRQYIIFDEIDADLIYAIKENGHDLISTIGLNQLDSLMGNEPEDVQFQNIYFVRGFYGNTDEYSYIYDLTDSKIKRIMPIGGEEAIYEFLNDATLADIRAEIANPKYIKERKYQITRELKLHKKYDIILEGRYAQVNHGYKLGTAIEKYLEV